MSGRLFVFILKQNDLFCLTKPLKRIDLLDVIHFIVLREISCIYIYEKKK